MEREPGLDFLQSYKDRLLMDTKIYNSDLQFVSFFEPETDPLESVTTCKFILLEHNGRKIIVVGLLDQFPSSKERPVEL